MRLAALDPYRLIEPVEKLFGSLFFYRSSEPEGRRTYLLASLEEAWQWRASGLYHRGRPAGETPDHRVDALLRAADREGGDVVLALAYDAPVARAALGDRLLGFAARVGHAVWYDEYDGVLTAQGDRDFATEVTRIAEGCAATPTPAPLPRSIALCDTIESLDESSYAARFETVREHLLRGDVYQAVMSSSVRVRPHMPLTEYFRQVAHRYRQADYSYWVSLGGERFFGACSLPHLSVKGDRVSTRVFAGTRPAVRDGAELARVRRLLREDSKYFAEHVMLVDLERNDLGAFCEPGSVVVRDTLEPVVIGSTTYLATTVQGQLSRGQLDTSALLGNFPRGVVTGAPKARAIRLLNGVEKVPRGFYCGAVGWYRGGRGLISNTVVTCGIREGNEVLLRCAGGVTVESSTEQELSELYMKLAYLV